MVGRLKVGIMGGTFNPVHFGHLILAENAFDAFELDKVIFIPSGDPPHKKGDKVISKEHREKMTQLAIEDNKHFDISMIELNRGGYSYTVDTLSALKSESPNNQYYFIVGADSLVNIMTWKEPEKIFNLCELIVAARGAIDCEKIAEIKEAYEVKYNITIHSLEMPIIDISSTDIRKRVEEGRTIKYFVPKDIEHYIYMNQLYR